MYRSGFENKIANFLRKNGIRFSYEPFMVEYFVAVRGCVCSDCGSTSVTRSTWYPPDFVLKDSGLVIEGKGRFTPDNRTRLLALLDTQEHITRENFRILFMRDNFLEKKTQANRYTDWCRKNNIICAVNEEGNVPGDWLTWRPNKKN